MRVCVLLLSFLVQTPSDFCNQSVSDTTLRAQGVTDCQPDPPAPLQLLGIPTQVPPPFFVESLLNMHGKCWWSFLGRILQASVLNPDQKSMLKVAGSHWSFSLTSLYQMLINSQRKMFMEPRLRIPSSFLIKSLSKVLKMFPEILGPIHLHVFVKCA